MIKKIINLNINNFFFIYKKKSYINMIIFYVIYLLSEFLLMNKI